VSIFFRARPMGSDEEFLSHKWDTDCIPTLEEYIRIPCQSPAYDPEWATNGLLDQAMDLLHAWVKKQDVKGMTSEVLHAPASERKTPFLVIQVPPTDPAAGSARRVLMYGHMDKQPPMLPWAEGLGPYQPVIRDGKLYGRGGADDGYAVFAAITALQALQRAGTPHGHVTIVVEADEESGSPSLRYWVQRLRDQIGSPDLVVCLDSSCLNYEQLWLTTSIRGAMNARLTVSLLSEGVHSGMFGGLVPDTFLIVRQLLSRVEDEATGEIKLPEAHVTIPPEALAAAKELDTLGPDLFSRDTPLLKGCQGFQHSTSELALGNFWRPCLTVTGVSGAPPAETAGNVLRPKTTLSISIRLPPTADAATAYAALRETLLRDPPYGAQVEVVSGFQASGWAAPPLAPWLDAALADTAARRFQRPFGICGIGGTIPFMGMLGEMFPQAQFVITGILGPKSNAHGPNEFLHIPYAKRLVGCVADLVAAHHRQFPK
jgi:acetylornithine deacetylase/succinyl-diaminopimelate desuccinylase-like protein